MIAWVCDHHERTKVNKTKDAWNNTAWDLSRARPSWHAVISAAVAGRYGVLYFSECALCAQTVWILTGGPEGGLKTKSSLFGAEHAFIRATKPNGLEACCIVGSAAAIPLRSKSERPRVPVLGESPLQVCCGHQEDDGHWEAAARHQTMAQGEEHARQRVVGKV